MTQIKETVGRLPVYLGDYDNTKVYKKKNRVTMFGSEFQSLIDNNTYAPAELSADETHIIFDTVHWKVISNGSDAYLNHLVVLNKLDEIDSKQESMQSEINGAQLEIGAVQTDIVPTQGSSNHMTSGAIYETLTDPGSGFVTESAPEEEGEKLVTEKAAAKTYGNYVENPEWIRVIVDSNWHILGGFKSNGEFEFSKGVPTPIREYIAEQLANMVTDISMKVDKEEGKGLIIIDFADMVSMSENPEWIDVKLDADNKIISGVKYEGTTFISKLQVGEFVGLEELLTDYGNGYLNVSKCYTTPSVITVFSASEGWKQVSYDESAYPYDETDTYNVGEVCNIDGDTEHSYQSLVRQQGNYPALQETKNVITEKLTLDTALAKIPSNILGLFEAGQVITFVDEDDIVEKWELQNDGSWSRMNPYEAVNPEFIQAELDAEDRILSYRKKDGVKYEDSLEVNHLSLTENGMTEFQQALKDEGFQPGGGGDWSDREIIEVPEPANYALLNLIISSLPLNDGDVSEGYAEYYDKAGNYFKLPVSLEPQGQTSRIFARTGGKGNYTADFPRDIKFGSWVPQDSFHLKGCAKDVVRGILPTSYKFAWEIMNYLDAKPNRVLIDESGITETNATGSRMNDWPTDARCLPDGFPCEVYVNGEYWGLYSWQLKKHRKNYSMDKKDYTSFFLDAEDMMTNDYTHGIWNDGPDDDTYRTGGWWTGFDIKGPKDLICMDGSEFDGDHPRELIDPTSEFYDSSNKKHKGSYTTKTLIRSFQTRYNEVKNLIDNDDIDNAKALFNEYFDYNSCMLVYIYNCMMKNGDSVKKNTLWGMYSSGKIFAALWDLDGMYGEGWVGNSASSPSSSMWDGVYATAEWPLKLLYALYADDIKDLYESLRKDKCISIEAWRNIVFGKWVNRIGEEAFNRDIKKWPETPSYRENETNVEFWSENGRRDSTNIGNIPIWDEGAQYAKDDIVALSMHPLSGQYMTYKANKASLGECPVTKFYTEFPMVGGFYDSPKRWQKWMEWQITLCDIKNLYLEEVDPSTLIADFTIYRNTDGEYTIKCTDMDISHIEEIETHEYIYVQGYVTRHESVIGGETVSTYSITGGAETGEDTEKVYTTVREAIEAAASQPADVPPSTLSYIKARAKNTTYRKR